MEAVDRDDDLRAEVVARLAAAGCIAADAEADELLAAAVDRPAVWASVGRRERGEPLPWITGSITFAGHRVTVHPGVYVPRFQSEELAARAAALLPAQGRAVDLCTGSGALAVHLQAEVPGATVVAVDLDPRAARCARANGLLALVGDLDGPLAADRVDVVTAVAPYVPTDQLELLPRDVLEHEPRLALDGGDDGLGVVRSLVEAAARLLRRGGWLLTEVGGDQDRLLAPDLDRHGFAAAEPWFDEDGDLRGLAARRR